MWSGQPTTRKTGTVIMVTTVRIVGPSMEPAVRNGQRWLCSAGRVRPGQVVVFTEPDRPGMVAVKRVLHREAGGWWVEGDNQPMSRDSRAFGPVADHLVLGILRLRLR